MPRPISTLTKFILSLPRDEVVAQAKAKGLQTGDSNVLRVRRKARLKVASKPGSRGAKKPAASAKASAAKQRTRPAKANGGSSKTALVVKRDTESKADFVRARPHLSPREVVEDAVAAGVKLDVGYVLNVRGYDKAVARKRRAAMKTGAKLSATEGGAASPVESLLLAVASEVGLGRAVALLEGERARVRAVIGG